MPMSHVVLTMCMHMRCRRTRYGLAGCCVHPLWDAQTRRVDFDVVWWSNGGLHYLHSGERTDKTPTLGGVLGASMGSYLDELRNCSKHLRARYKRAVHIYKLSNWVCAESFNGPWRDSLHRYMRSPESPKYTLAFNELGAIALNAAERELGRDGDGTADDQATLPYVGSYDLGVRGPAHVLQDSLTAGRCECTCDGVHYPLIMPALIVRLADKVQRLGNASSAPPPPGRAALAKATTPYGFGASAPAPMEDHARTLRWTSFARKPGKGGATCV